METLDLVTYGIFATGIGAVTAAIYFLWSRND